MMNDQHPLAIELLAAASYEPGTENIRDHIRGCVSCQAEFDLLTEAAGDTDQTVDSAAVRRILEAAPSLPPSLLNDDNPAAHGEPIRGELWRIGNAEEAVLAWVSSVVGNAAIVIPMLLDLELADDSSIYVEADDSPLRVDAILLNDLARAVPLSAFLTLLGPLIVPDNIEDDSRRLVGAAVIGDNLAFPIENPHDMRIEPRLEIEELFNTLTAPNPDPHTLGHWDYAYAFETLREDLRNRIFGSNLHPLPRTVFDIQQTYTLTCLAKVTHLQTSTVIAVLSGNDPQTVFNADILAEPCQEVLRREPDANAVAVVIPIGEWVTALFTSADTHAAFAAPTGAHVGPTTTYFGYGILDTMHKYLDGRVTAWEETEATPTRLNISDIQGVVQRHAALAVEGIRKSGSRSKAPKKTVWTELPSSMDESVARFVQALLNNIPIAEALENLGPEDDR